MYGTPLGNYREHERLAGTILTGKKWETGRVLRVSFDWGGDPRVIERLKKHMLGWTEYANIDFEFGARGGDIRIAFDPKGGSWSYLGTDAKMIPAHEPTMNFGWLEPGTSETEYMRVVPHEAGHALAMPHEHQHPRNGIPWDEAAVYRYYRGAPNYWDDETIRHNIFYRYSESQTQFDEFDPKSIMLYPIPNELTIGDFQVGWNVGLSEGDRKFAEWSYPGRRKPVEPPAKPAPITITRLVKRGVTEETNVTRAGKPWITARPWNES
jgi:hypothetical protein